MHVLKDIIAENRETGADNPPIVIRRGKTKRYAKEVLILGLSKVRYDQDKSPAVWIETTFPVKKLR